MIEKINGIEMAYDDQGKGPAVVLIHGFPLCRRMWRPQIAALDRGGYRLVAPDLRGFGDSEAPRGPYSMDVFADDVVALLDHLGIAKAVVGGMSMGGYVLLNLLERHPQRVAGALFIVTRAAADDEPGRMRRTSLALEVARGRPQVVSQAFADVLFAPRTIRAQPERVAEVAGWMNSADPRGLAGGLLAMRDRRDYSDRLAAIGLPTLVIGAEQDRAIPSQESRSLAAGIAGAELRVLSGAGHMVNLEQPQAFNDAVLDFLSRL